MSASAGMAQDYSPVMTLETPFAATEVIVPSSPLRSQVLFIGGVDEVQTVDANGNPNGTEIAKQWHDFIGITEDTESNDLGWVSVNHEMIQANEKIGDGGGMTVFKVRRGNDGFLEVVEQTLTDGRQGRFFNVDFVNTVGETGMNCGGIQSSVDGRIWTAEEWFQGSNDAISGGITDLTPYTVSSDLDGDFNGQTIERYQNLNYMVEINPREAKAVRKQYNWGRQPFEGGAVASDNKTVYLGVDDTPGYFSRFTADTPGDFTKGKLEVYVQNDGTFAGGWVEIANDKMADMLNYKALATAAGATMFNRLEWVAYNKDNGKVYVTETGRDNPAGRWADEQGAGASIARHHMLRAQEQGADVLDADENKPSYWDYYGRVLEFDPATNEMKVFLEAGPFWDPAGPGAQYPSKHLSNPDGLNFLYVNGKDYMLICEDLNGTSFGRMPVGFSNRACELYMLDMDDTPSIDNLVRVAVTPIGAEITGAVGTPDGKSILVNSQHPDEVVNEYPYNNSCTIEITGWDQVITSIAEDDRGGDTPDGISFNVYPNPVTRTLKFDKVMNVGLYDTNGRLVRSKGNTDRLDILDLPAGVYYLQNEAGETAKVVIQ